MKKIETIGIIGMGTIGISISYILQEAGLNVIGFKHKNRKSEEYKKLIEKDKIVVINSANTTSFPKKTPLKIQITSSLKEIVEKADLILNCCRFPQNSTMYQFSELEKSIIKKKNTPTLIIPGSLGANWLVGQENIKVGLVGYSPVFATSKVTADGITVNLLDFKSKIPLAYDDVNIRKYLISFLNKHFKFKTDGFTFIDGGSTLKTALSSPILAINAAAICDNAQVLINSKGKAITKEIYVLSETYSQLFQKIFDEQIMVAKLMEMDNLQSLKNWLSNRVISIKPNNSITEMLGNIYKGKQVTISGQDRRITESFYALLFFKNFANVLGCSVPTTEELLGQIINLQLKLHKNNFPIHLNLSIEASAKSYANHILNNIKQKESNVYTALH